MKHTFIYLLLLFFASCSDWLDVTPRIQIKEADNFTTAQGYKDALAGVYMLMTGETTYGRELSFGLVDVLAKQYTSGFGTLNEYYYPSTYNYTAEASKTKFASIWAGMYNTIANVNSLVARVDKADTMLFAPDEYHVIRGEAYGLRAFLHFDLLRLFGPAPVVDPDAKAIPYVTAFNARVTPLSTVRQAIDRALADLAVAEAELKAHDPVTRGLSSADYTDYFRNRHYRFNYYAVKLLQARVHLYEGDHGAARAAAEEVIAQSLFTWVPESQVVTTSAETRNLVFWQELIFTLNMNNIAEIAFGTTGSRSWFTTGSGGFTKSPGNWNTVYETALHPTDYRNVYLMSDPIDGYYVTSRKLYQPTGVYGQDFINKMPIMRLSEAYYIAAEAALRLDDKPGAVAYLNTARARRYITTPLPATLPDEAVQEEIRKEYAKEFICEGQLFYYYKRLNSETIQFYSPYNSPLPRDLYVLPLPEEEIDYGQRHLEAEQTH
ncbi:MAG: RagB/SusD family nutrient uptake outer membrane protein [Odoribacteraceae bacterium]|jgi:hypothetical protein|nr:RagB/SusD family nutrient uptake outer membrane protein [Odoribacteraceae bacterium]